MTRLHRLALAWRIARRELRSGLSGFRIFLTCLALGVASIAGVGTVRSAIEAGLAEQGTVLLGGDAQVELTYRLALSEHVSLQPDFQCIFESGAFKPAPTAVVTGLRLNIGF